LEGLLNSGFQLFGGIIFGGFIGSQQEVATGANYFWTLNLAEDWGFLYLHGFSAGVGGLILKESFKEDTQGVSSLRGYSIFILHLELFLF